LYCQQCGALADGPFCTSCGKAQPGGDEYPSAPSLNPQFVTESPALIAARQAAYREELRGVRGWLLFLCFVLVFGKPILCVSAAFRIFANPIWRHKTPDMITAVVNVLIAACSIIAGLKLWLVKPRAEQFAKDFFLVSAAVSVSQNIALRVVWGVPNVERFVVANLFSSALWYLYLTYSDRVRFTYEQA